MHTVVNPIDYGFAYNKDYKGYVAETDSYVYHFKKGAVWYMDCYKKPVSYFDIGWRCFMTLRGFDDDDFNEVMLKHDYMVQLKEFVFSHLRKSFIDSILLDLN